MAADEGRHKITGEHQYDGMTMPPFVPRKVLDRIKHLDLSQDTLIASYPKTGSTWVQEIVWLIVTNMNVDTASRIPIDDRIYYMEVQNHPRSEANIDKVLRQPRPRLIKTHLPVNFFQQQLTNNDLKVIVPLRNPKDTLVSYYHFYKMVVSLGKFSGSWSDFYEDLFQNKRLVYGDIMDWYEGWWAHRSRVNMLYVKYEDMQSDLNGEIRRIAKFLGKELSDGDILRIQSLCTFGAMKENDMVNYSWMEKIKIFDGKVSKFMRKGTVGDWKNYFTPAQNAALDLQYASQLVPIGLKFDFETKHANSKL